MDSGELILAAATGDLAHPPGFPAYVLLGRLFSWLPIGSPAFRLSLMSAFFGAVTLGLLALLLAALARRVGHRGTSLDGFLFATSALLPLLSESFVAYATVAEVYTFNTALFVGALVLLAERMSTFGVRVLGLVVGLGLAGHHASWVLWGPALALFYLVGRRADGPLSSRSWTEMPRRLRELLPALPWTVLGLATYLYLPVAARAAWLGWGDVTSWQRFWWHVSAGQYRAYWSQMTFERWTAGLVGLGELLGTHFTIFGAVVAMVGLVLWWRLDRAVWMLLVTGTVCTVAYVAAYDIAEDGDAYLLPIFLLYVVAWTAIPLTARQILPSRKAGAVSTATVLALWTALASQMPAGSGVHRLFTLQGRADEGLARVYVEDLVADVAPGGLVLTKDWQFHAPFLYLQRLQGFRSDLTVINLNLLRYSWYLKHLDRATPPAMQACAAERRAYETLLRAWENNAAVPPEDLTRTYNALVEALIRRHLDHQKEVHPGLPIEDGIGAAYTWQPRALTFQLLRQPTKRPLKTSTPRWQHLQNPDLRPPASTKVRSVYTFMLRTRGDFLRQAGFHEEAGEALKAASELDVVVSGG